MEMLIVQGGRPLKGTVQVSGAKNAALPILAATIAVPGRATFTRIPQLRDITSMTELLTQLGLTVTSSGEGAYEIDSSQISSSVADYELVRKMRASICVLGPLLARQGQACVSLPGGCNIGHRPIDLHLKGLAALGADISIRQGYVMAQTRQLRGSRIFLGGPHGSTVTGTCNVLSAAVLARGTTVIEAAACEPEVVDLGHFLMACGARIEGLGTPCLTIDGVEQLQPPARPYQIIPDRIEAATWLIAAAMTQGHLLLEDTSPEPLAAVISELQRVGVQVESTTAGLKVQGTGRPRCGDLVSLPYPGFPTDVQAQWTALMCLSEGVSVVTDHVFPERFMHAAELMRMGARIRREGNSVIIEGVPRLSGAHVMASDLRASAALVLAALAAEGETVIRRIYHLDRGYEKLAEKLTALGADVQRVEDRAEGSFAVRQPHWNSGITAIRDRSE